MAQINAWLFPLTLGGHQHLYIRGLTSANLAKWEHPPAARKMEEPWRWDISVEKNDRGFDVNQSKGPYKSDELRVWTVQCPYIYFDHVVCM